MENKAMHFIDIPKQYRLHREEILKAMEEVLDDGRFILGPAVHNLEAALAEYVGTKHCISASSGTDSLLIALMALGIGPGDEVITTPFTFISPAEMTMLLGARPVFVDIEPTSFNIDPAKIEAAITPRTKAIIPVSIFGQMPDMDAINAIAERHQLAVIEDGAQSFGATQRGERCCSRTLIGSTSFFPAKTLGCYGDGGAIFTNDDELAAKMVAIRHHGQDKPREHRYLGINGRMDSLQAAIVLTKLPHFPQEVADRERLGARYTELLKGCCTAPAVMPGNTHVYGQYTLRVPDREAVKAKLTEEKIPFAVHYTSGLHQQPVFDHLNYPKGSFPETEKACQEVISLPMHPWLSEEDQDRIVGAVKAALCVNV